MRTWTIILAAATLLLASCSEEGIKPDKTLTGSISYHYDRIETKVYLNEVAIEHEYSASCGFLKLDEEYVTFNYHIRWSNNGNTETFGMRIKNIKVYGRPYDVTFDHYSESRENEIYMNSSEYIFPASVKIEGKLYNYLAEVVYTPSFATRDWSPPVFTADLKITVLLTDGTEYLVEITRI